MHHDDGHPRATTVVCTLGPASDDEATIRDLVEAGAAVVRLNASHGDPTERATTIDRVRAVDAETDTPVATMLDLAGPEVRTRLAEPLALSAGDRVALVETDDPLDPGGEAVVGLSRSVAAAGTGARVLFDDGRVETRVRTVDGDRVEATVEAGGRVADGEGVNVPGVDLGYPAVTDADRRDLALAAEKAVEFVAASHVRTGEDVRAVARAVADHGVEVPVIAKVERADAVENLDSVLAAADGVMVARGDLGVECPLEEVPLIQKRILRRAGEAGVPTITATEMLDSMVSAPRPTRAEASDVANAVLDGTDAVMLSGETAVGEDPVRVVETIDRIVRDVEESPEYDRVRERSVPDRTPTRTDALARSARSLARDVDAAAVVVASESGYTARVVAKYRPPVPVVAATPDHHVRRRLSLSRGVIARHTPAPSGGVDEVILGAVDTAVAAGVVDRGDTVVVVSGSMTDLGTDATNTLKLHVAAETVAEGRPVVGGRATGPLFRSDPATDYDAADASVPEGSVLAVDADRDATAGERSTGDAPLPLDRVAAVVHAGVGLSPAIEDAVRAAGVPTVVGAVLPTDLATGDPVTVDAERGVVFRGPVGDPAPARGDERLRDPGDRRR
jgi:pyruvate kinase